MTNDPQIDQKMQEFGEILSRVAGDNPELWTLAAQIQSLSDACIEPEVQEFRILSTDSTSCVASE